MVKQLTALRNAMNTRFVVDEVIAGVAIGAIVGAKTLRAAGRLVKLISARWREEPQQEPQPQTTARKAPRPRKSKKQAKH